MKEEAIEVIQAKQMLKVIEDDFYPKIIQSKIDNKHKDSFFYDGTVAQITKPNGTELFLIATGDINIYKDTKDGFGELVFDGKERNSGFDFDFSQIDDDKLHRLEEYGYTWENNNWFEVTWKKKDEDFIDCAIGDIAGDYDEAMDLLKSYFENDNY